MNDFIRIFVFGLFKLVFKGEEEEYGYIRHILFAISMTILIGVPIYFLS